MDDLEIKAGVTIPGRELREAFVRSGGPGGQHVNKTATKVVLRWRPGDSDALSEDDQAWLRSRLARRLSAAGEIVVTSDRTRDQARNRDDARRKLAALVSRALERPRPRKRRPPPRRARERRLAEKRRRQATKQQRRAPGREAQD